MRLVIDMPDEEYERIQAMDWKNGHRWYSYETIAIHNGTPLPKGHGRLIDADDINNHIIGSVDTRDCPIIIEADTARDCKTCGHSNKGKCAYTEECHECMWVNKYIEAGGGEE